MTLCNPPHPTPPSTLATPKFTSSPPVQDSRFKAAPNPSPHSAKLHCVPLAALEASPAPPLQGRKVSDRRRGVGSRIPEPLTLYSSSLKFKQPSSKLPNANAGVTLSRRRRHHFPPGAVRPEPRRTGSETSLKSSNGRAFPELPQHVPNRASGPSLPPVRPNTRDPRLRVAAASGGSHSNFLFSGVRFDNSPVSATTDSPRSYREPSPSHDQHTTTRVLYAPTPTRSRLPHRRQSQGRKAALAHLRQWPGHTRRRASCRSTRRDSAQLGRTPRPKSRTSLLHLRRHGATWKEAMGRHPAAYRPPSDVDTSMLVPLGQGAVPGVLNDAMMKKVAAGGGGSSSGGR
ncbi:hypothetical protein M427DRAFT_269243 [Gonapodya prolifera JEL478]|uniref:Uncharacterized protein n=1 Tax=Gonapodya prolifera (strain JEL478) TaxID=1344416 RepID=A0A139AJU9_GONPJ|nr:hypothetical protein M427DRAFT_269243 [Gonapodya prolifera JEL478]|eukprot:KXS17041.1 hypothetical protein M427DRAFT_269243 [Gonapodya prolifera JEL478]